MSDEGDKYQGAANFCWLIAILMGAGVGAIKHSIGWSLVTGAITMLVVSTGLITAIYCTERKQ